jgi:small subunit ribosomal protein S16
VTLIGRLGRFWASLVFPEPFLDHLTCAQGLIFITISGYLLPEGDDMVTIRLTRRGGKKTPFYHVVVTDSRKRQGGMSLESVGLFNPVARGAEVKLRLNVARIEHWLGEGAHMSDRVKQLLTTFRKQAVAA